MNSVVLGIGAAVAGLALGGGLARAYFARRETLILRKNQTLIREAEEEAKKIKEHAQRAEGERQGYLKELEQGIRRRQDALDRRSENLDKEREVVSADREKLRELENKYKEHIAEQKTVLEKVAKLSKEDARDQLLKEVETDFAEDIKTSIKKYKEDLREAQEIEARKIIALAISRIATETASEMVSAAVALPNEELKGRIIGKEGRNVQAFEKAAGVDVIVDETPDSVMVSSFDPVRRYTAKLALEALVKEGRINPTKIEEMLEKSRKQVGKEIKEAGEGAAYELGLTGLNPELLKVVGRLQFRTSYGQNVLRHSIEAAHIAAIIASELKADVAIVKKGALLHDVGKALDHDVPGTHTQISVDICRKYGLSEAVTHTVEAHHGDIEPRTVEALIVQAAEAISAARPGARRDSYEAYVKRLTELENVANSFPGVEKSFAIQAGREVRIIVKPQDVSDLGAVKLAKQIAKKVEDSLQYPGQIKVHVIRETRAVEIAK